MKKPAKIRAQKPESIPASVSRVPPAVLVAVTGMSPAILTETAWALAHVGAQTGPRL